jgi:hypothetical protein
MRCIDPFQIGWLDSLCEKAVTGSETNTLLLLDCAFFPGLWQRLVQMAPEQRACVALFDGLPGCDEAALAVSPMLVDFRTSDPGLRRVLFECDRRPMVTLIRTVDTVPQLAARLRHWCVVDADGTLFNFRFPDTRRLPAIARTLTAAQRAQLLGPAYSWHCINRFGRWESLPMAPEVEASDEAPALTASQFSALVADSEPDEILAVLEPDFAELARDALPSWRFLQAQQALAAADARGVRDISERIAWVGSALKSDSRRFEPLALFPETAS